MMLLIRQKKFVKIKKNFFIYCLSLLEQNKNFFWGDPLGHPKGPQRAYLGTLGPP